MSLGSFPDTAEHGKTLSFWVNSQPRVSSVRFESGAEVGRKRINIQLLLE